MPIIFQEKISSSVSMCVWKITETEEFLLSGLELSESDLRKLETRKNPDKRLEMIASRKALAHLLNTNQLDIHYTHTGQPEIPGYHISLSHSNNHAAAVISRETEVGIDLEKIDPKILRLYPKFMNENEIAQNDVTDPVTIHYYWSAKEALFKLYGKGNVLFAENLLVEKPENFIKGSSYGYLSFGATTKIQLENRIIGEMMLVVGYRF